MNLHETNKIKFNIKYVRTMLETSWVDKRKLGKRRNLKHQVTRKIQCINNTELICVNFWNEAW